MFSSSKPGPARACWSPILVLFSLPGCLVPAPEEPTKPVGERQIVAYCLAVYGRAAPYDPAFGARFPGKVCTLDGEPKEPRCFVSPTAAVCIASRMTRVPFEEFELRPLRQTLGGPVWTSEASVMGLSTTLLDITVSVHAETGRVLSNETAGSFVLTR